MSEQVRRPHPSRLDPRHRHYDEICVRHETACRAGLSSYIDPASGYVVLTDHYLSARGYCCSSGCRHCPYVDQSGHQPRTT